MNTYALGTRVRTTATFTDLVGSPVDPDTVRVYVKAPDGVESSYTIADGVQHPQTGTYSYAFLLDQRGIWTYRWEGVGGADVATMDIRILTKSSIFA